MKRTNLLQWVRRTWAQGAVGKTVATVLLAAMGVLVRFSFSHSALDEQPPIISVNIPHGSLWLKQVTPQIVVKDDIGPKPTFVALLGDEPYRVGTPIREPGVYELRILARDSLGNSSEKAVTFQVLEQPHYIASLAVVQWHYEVEGDWAGLDAWLLLYGPFIPDKRLQALGGYPEAIPVCVVEPLHFSMLVLDEEGMPLNRGEAILPAGIKMCEADSSPRYESVYYDTAKDIVALHFRVTPQERILRKGVPVSVKIVGVATVKTGDFTFEAGAASSANPAFGDLVSGVRETYGWEAE